MPNLDEAKNTPHISELADDDLVYVYDVSVVNGVRVMRVDDFLASVPTPPTTNVVHFRRQSVLSLTHNDWTVIPLDEVFYDTDGMADTGSGRIVCNRAGWYQATINGTLKNPTGPIGRVAFRAALLRSDDTYVADVMWAETDNLVGYTMVTQSFPLYLNVGDQLELRGFQNSGGEVQIEESNPYHRPFLALSEISPVELPEVVPLISRKVVGSGDSQTEGSLCGADFVWGEWLSPNFVNLGHSGITSTDIINTYLSEITSSADPSADFVLWIGTNDIGYNVGIDVETIVDNIEDIMDAARPLYRSINYIVPGPSTISTYANAANYEADRQDLIAAVVARDIPDMTIVRLDLDEDIGEASDANNRVFYMDFLHATPLAQKRVAELTAAVIP